MKKKWLTDVGEIRNAAGNLFPDPENYNPYLDDCALTLLFVASYAIDS